MDTVRSLPRPNTPHTVITGPTRQRTNICSAAENIEIGVKPHCRFAHARYSSLDFAFVVINWLLLGLDKLWVNVDHHREKAIQTVVEAHHRCNHTVGQSFSLFGNGNTRSN